MTPDQPEDTALFPDSVVGSPHDVGAFVAAQLGKAGSSKRIDPPHQARSPVVPPPITKPESPSPPVSEAAGERVRLQAEQLALQLGSRQRELDHRESELNARIARLETEIRAARLWFDQRESELAIQAEESAKKRRESELEGADARRRALEEAEQRLADGLAELDALRSQLVTRWKTAQDEVAARQEEMAAEHRRAIEDVARKRQALARRAERLDDTAKALQRLRNEIARIHRETLEHRLATEEAAARFFGDAPPAALTESIVRLRAALAEQHRRTESEWIEQGKHLAAVRKQLARQHGALVERKRRFERWAASRREDLLKQAARLTARERQLRQTELLHAEQEQRCREDRLNLEREIRRLRGEKETSPDQGDQV